MNTRKTIELILGLLIIHAVLFGCASFPGKGFTKYSYDQILKNTQKCAIRYDAKALVFGKESIWAGKSFQEEVAKVLRESDLFDILNMGSESQDYHFSFEIDNRGNILLAGISGFISGFTLTLVPGYARDEYTLRVRVSKNNQLLKQYQYDHYMDSWIQLFLIFLTPTHNTQKVYKEVVDDMLIRFLYDIQKDGLLKCET